MGNENIMLVDGVEIFTSALHAISGTAKCSSGVIPYFDEVLFIVSIQK